MKVVRRVSAERGWAWFREAWTLFKGAPGVWVGMSILFFVILLGGQAFNTIGDAVSSVLEPVLMVGIYFACKEQWRGGRPRLNHLFEGFKGGRVFPLAGLGALDFGSSELLSWAGRSILLQGEGWGELLKPQFWHRFFAEADVLAIVKFCAVGALGATAYIVLGAAFWFAPALIGLDRARVGAALRESFLGVMRNIPAMLVYGLTAVGFAVLASVPFYLGLIAFLPVFLITVYVSYRDVFTHD